MGRTLHAAVLLAFAIMLSFAGIQGNVWNSMAPAPAAGNAAAQSQPNVSQTRQVKYLLINRASEVVVSAVHPSTAPGPQLLRSYFLNNVHAVEHGIQRLITQYLSLSRGISCSFTSNDIIFPFHYFW